MKHNFKLLIPTALTISSLPAICLVGCSYTKINIDIWDPYANGLASQPTDIVDGQNFNFIINMNNWNPDTKDYHSYDYFMLYVDNGTPYTPFKLKQSGFKIALDGKVLSSDKITYSSGQFIFNDEQVKQDIFACKEITGKVTIDSDQPKTGTTLTFYFCGQLKPIQ